MPYEINQSTNMPHNLASNISQVLVSVGTDCNKKGEFLRSSIHWVRVAIVSMSMNPVLIKPDTHWQQVICKPGG